MSSILPFDKASIDGQGILPEDFILGTGKLSIKASDKSVTTADGAVHYVRTSCSKQASFEAFGDWTSLSSQMGDASEVALFCGGIQVASFNAIVSASYSSESMTSSISLYGDPE